ncbi:hypothetical protein QQ054_10410 [Oscillatoria amoena NRMC-F 0135]|nr:hypothetical protein [Oscillatoria amoena NRMC-F 0135]
MTKKIFTFIFLLASLFTSNFLLGQTECIQEQNVLFPYQNRHLQAGKCDFNVCITYKLVCPGQPDSEYNICSVITEEGDANLSYYNYVCADECSFTLQKIEITRIPTSETITIMGVNATQFMNLATQQVFGSLYLGTFSLDCAGNPTTEDLWLYRPTNPLNYGAAWLGN